MEATRLNTSRDEIICETTKKYLSKANMSIDRIVGTLLQMSKDHLQREEHEHIKTCTMPCKTREEHTWKCKYHTYPAHVYTQTDPDNGDVFHYELHGSREINLHVRLNDSNQVLLAPNVIYDY